MKIRLIALDFDGTLLNEEKKLSEGNREAIEECLARGIYIIPATGRTASGIPGFIREIPGIRYAILTNGAKVMDLQENKIISQELIDWELARKILTFLSDFPVAYDPYVEGRGKMEARFRDHLENYGVPPVMRQMVRSTRDEVEDEIQLLSQRRCAVEKINVFTADRKLRQDLWNQLSSCARIKVTSSLEYNLEINAASATKGEGLARLAGYLGIRMEETMACGDGTNDLSMIQAAGIGVAMENAMDAVKEQADYITLSNEHDGVAEAIRRFALN